MEKKKDFYKTVEDICRKDTRYGPQAYEFVMHALHFTQGKIKKEGHVTGRELLLGIRDYAAEQFGPLAKTVLNHWGINTTQDIGHIVFNMVDNKLLSKTDTDSLEDFKDVYNFGEEFRNVLRDSIKKINSLN